MSGVVDAVFVSQESLRVQRATLDDLDIVKQTRWRALTEAPYAFGSTLAQEQALSDDEWRSRLSNGAWFLARGGALPIGIVAAFTEADHPESRHLVAMWVEPAQRGTSIATELVAAVLAWACEDKADAVTLWVADGNPRASRLYARLGFILTGRRQPLPSDPSVGESEMSRPLH